MGTLISDTEALCNIGKDYPEIRPLALKVQKPLREALQQLAATRQGSRPCGGCDTPDLPTMAQLQTLSPPPAPSRLMSSSLLHDGAISILGDTFFHRVRLACRCAG